MDPAFIIAVLSSWIVRLFPSLAEYTKYVGPAVLTSITALGIFTNLLPDPGRKYPVPDVSALETQLQGSAGFILRIAKFTRGLTIGMNWFIDTAVYSCFYNTTNTIASVIPFVKKKTAK